MSHEVYGLCNYRQLNCLDCFFNTLSRLATKTYQNTNAEMVSMPWRHHPQANLISRREHWILYTEFILCKLHELSSNWNHPLQWRHNGHDSVANHQSHNCLLNRLFRRRSKKTSKLCITGLCVGNSPGTGEFPAQMASNAEKVSIWWRHHDHSVNIMRSPSKVGWR